MSLLEAEDVSEVMSYRFLDLDGDPDGEQELVIESYTEPFHRLRGHGGRYGLGSLVFGWDGKAYSEQRVGFDSRRQALVYKLPQE